MQKEGGQRRGIDTFGEMTPHLLAEPGPACRLSVALLPSLLSNLFVVLHDARTASLAAGRLLGTNENCTAPSFGQHGTTATNTITNSRMCKLTWGQLLMTNTTRPHHIPFPITQVSALTHP